jgi:hypothetical protein
VIYTQYLETLKGNFAALSDERKKQLLRIQKIRKREVLVIASAISKGPQAAIDQTDLLPIYDQLETLKGTALDVILETPGGSGETTEDIVRLLRKGRNEVNFIIPGVAKSAGTIMVTSGDDILMGPLSSLGPIDAQVQRDGKLFSAEAFIEGLNRIKEETDKNSYLNRAYIPILQAISPGEIEAARNALKFGKRLAASWLQQYKFKHWETHQSDGRNVTEQEREERAKEVAERLGAHSEWLSHNRSIKIEDLQKMGIRVTNYEDVPELADAILRYHIVLQMSFETNIYKVYETPTSQILRFQGAPPPANQPMQELQWQCPSCKNLLKLQLNFVPNVPIQHGRLPFPPDNKLTCPVCKTQSDLSPVRLHLEASSKRKIL